MSSSSLPDFLILGAARSGTTALHAHLEQHPSLFLSPIKEPHFFAYGEASFHFKGPGDAEAVSSSLSFSEYKRLFANAGEKQLCGEASASSLYVARAVDRIEKYTPQARMIVILRNPVDRAYSNYLLFVRDGREPCKSFREALELESVRIRQGWEHGWHYKQLGFYHEQLQRFYNRFDSDQIYTCLFDDFSTDPVALVQDIFSFLKVDDRFTPDTSTPHNRSGHPQSKLLHWILHSSGIGASIRSVLPDQLTETIGHHARPAIRWIRRLKKHLISRNLDRPPMPPAMRQHLQSLYREDILRLQDLIDRDLSHWLDAPGSAK